MSGVFVSYCVLTLCVIYVSDVFGVVCFYKKVKITEGHGCHDESSYVSTADQLLVVVPFIQDPPSWDFKERVVIGYHN